MADYNYLGLVNEVNRRLNEVELTSANFATASGFYHSTKDSVNSAIRHINHEEFGWPFNHIEQEDVLTAGIIRYGYPQDAKFVDMDSFRIKKDTDLNVNTKLLKYVDYKDGDFLIKFVNEQGKILPRRITGTSLKYQRKVAQAIKRCRHLGLMPYVTDLYK